MQPSDYAYLYDLEDKFWWFAGMRDITSALLDPLCPPTRSRLILDAGCGTGGMMSWLKRYAGNGRVAGVDLSPTALNFCGKRGHNMLARASVTMLPFPDSMFDLVTSFDVLEQLPTEGSDEAALGEMLRVLRPAGVTFVRVPAYDRLKSDHDRALATQHRYSLDELKSKMKRAGFEILRTTYANSLLMPVAAFRRLVLKRLGLASAGSDVKPLPASLLWINSALAGALRTEASLLKGPNAKLPFGLSAICVARKPPSLHPSNARIACDTSRSSSVLS
jgi:ubiquinone/menaquinone biosynthesis C-methylase UbiE